MFSHIRSTVSTFFAAPDDATALAKKAETIKPITLTITHTDGSTSILTFTILCSALDVAHELRYATNVASVDVDL